MRLVIDYTPALHQGAGIGRHTRELVAALEPLAGSHRVTLLVLGKPPSGQPWQAPKGFRLRLVPIPNRWLAVGWHRLKLPLPVTWLSGATDLYHASDFVLPPVHRARTLLTVHDLSFLAVPSCAHANLRSYLTRAVPPSVARADHIAADSESTKRDLMDMLQVPESQVTVIYPGVDLRFRPPTDDTALQRVRRQFSLGQHPFILGVSTLEPRKNWPALIRAWALLRRETALPHHLVIAGGKGWLYEEIFAAATATGMEQEIHFTGFVADSDLPALYGAADLFAFPSRYEGFGIPVVEALACGTPVVCANNSSLPEAAGGAALLVDADDEPALASAMRRLIEDTALRQDLRQRGLTHVRKFNWQAAAMRLLDTYEGIVDRA